MPKIQCPNHPDCSIECPETGYAYFVPPYGPCVKGCKPSKAKSDLLQILDDTKWVAKFSGVVIGITGGLLAEVGREIAERGPGDAREDALRLIDLGRTAAERRFDASWVHADGVRVVRTLAEASYRGGDAGGSMRGA